MSPPAPPANVYLIDPHEVTKVLPPLAEGCYEELRDRFSQQQTSGHTLATDPDSAELVLAPIQSEGYGPCFEALRDSLFYRRYTDKLMIYSVGGNQLPTIRGLYPSITRQWVRKGWAFPAHYISSHHHKFLFKPEEVEQKDILFSFVGSSRTHRIREQIMRWRHPEAVLVDASPKTSPRHWWENADKERFVDSFRDITRRSKFVVCPRGISPSSIRLFEAMEASAVPVIIGDSLELPLGPDWACFSLRVRERDIATVPQLIEKTRDRAPEMGAAARSAWEEFFSPESTVASVVSWARALHSHSCQRPFDIFVREFASPRYLKTKLRRHLTKRKRALASV